MGIVTLWLESLYEQNKVTNNCIRYISPKSTCNICIDVCTKQSLKLNEAGLPTINLKSCDSCKKCVAMCPTAAIEGQLPKRKYNNDYLFIDDDHHFPTEKELFFLYKKGIRFLIIDEPSNVTLEMEKVVTEVNSWLTALQLEPLSFTSNIPEVEKKETITRRDLFIQLREQSRKSVIANYTPASWRTNHRLLHLNELAPEYGFYRVEINKAECILCNICSSLCPEQTIKMTVEDGQNEFIISNHTCIGCNLCKDVCPKNCIEVKKQVTRDQINDVTLFFVLSCKSCNDNFFSWSEDKDHCHLCNRKKYLS